MSHMTLKGGLYSATIYVQTGYSASKQSEKVCVVENLSISGWHSRFCAVKQLFSTVLSKMKRLKDLQITSMI